eukprot:NODE_6107_length_1705_cov_3.204056.p8 GENE.NODE_6107_length_1705_cov_3.204056~~NODE_6107_length_1705_cov_3.204056.p8  ORF type:complete len:51 (-),score=15.54 NODE_6107_length_1705_cov_3.204056:81-233(-)
MRGGELERGESTRRPTSNIDWDVSYMLTGMAPMLLPPRVEDIRAELPLPW